MAAEKPDILYLEINGEIVEDSIRVVSKADEERIVVGLKKSYHLSIIDDYAFFYKRQSKMNGQTRTKIRNVLHI
jgi:hypothetical protein